MAIIKIKSNTNPNIKAYPKLSELNDAELAIDNKSALFFTPGDHVNCAAK